MLANDALSYLGRRGRDRITDYEGWITSISFDLYGYGKLIDCLWFDINRVEILDTKRIMPVPPQFGAKAPPR